MTTRVEVLPPFKVAKDGQVWRPGEVAEVDDATADRWARYGYVEVLGVLPEPKEQPAKGEPEHHRRRSPKEEPDEQSDGST